MNTKTGSQHAPLRDVLAGLYNLEVLLGSPRAATSVILDVLPELSRGARMIEAAFADATDPPGGPELARFARGEADGLAKAIDGVDRHLDPRARLALLAAVSAARPGLEAAVDLLSLVLRANAFASPVPTELRSSMEVAELVRVAFSGAAPTDKRAARVHWGEGRGVLVHDAHIVTALLRHAAAKTQSNAFVVRGLPNESGATFTIDSHAVEESQADGYVLLPLRIAPTDAALARVLAAVGGEIASGDGGGVLLSVRSRAGLV